MSGFRSAMSPERSGNVTGARRSPGTGDKTGRTFRAQIHGDEPAEEATHMKVDGSEGFQAHVEVMCAPLGELVGAFQALRERRSFLPDANSEAMRELSEQSKYAGAWGDEPSALAHNLAHLQLAAAEDCIEAVIGVDPLRWTRVAPGLQHGGDVAAPSLLDRHAGATRDDELLRGLAGAGLGPSVFAVSSTSS